MGPDSGDSMPTRRSVRRPKTASRRKPRRPSAVRFSVLASLASMTFILYLDRVCIAQAAGPIQAELHLSNRAMGFVFGAFTLSYGLFELPTGRLADRFGSRRVLTRIVLWWSAFTALTGAVLEFWALLAVRFLFGAGEAGALPTAARVVRRWFPEESRGKAQGVVATAMMVGGAASYVIAAALLEAFGWRWCFFLFGAVGVVWAVVFHGWFRDEPGDHPGVNDAERHLIDAGRPPVAQGEEHPPIPWRLVLTSRNVWLLGALMTCGAAVFYALFSWFPTYLQQGRGVSSMTSGWMSSLVLGGGAVGSAVGGVLTDYVLRRTGSAGWARSGLGSVAFAVGGAVLLVGLGCESPVLTACCTAVALFCVQLQIPAWWGTVFGISGKHVGSLSGLMNSLGCFGAALAPLFLGYATDFLKEGGATGRAQWDPGLYVFTGIMFTASALWLFVNPNRSAVEATPPAPAWGDEAELRRKFLEGKQAGSADVTPASAVSPPKPGENGFLPLP